MLYAIPGMGYLGISRYSLGNIALHISQGGIWYAIQSGQG